MESTTVKLYSLNYGNVRTYLAASLFIVGNILFPQFFHLSGIDIQWRKESV